MRDDIVVHRPDGRRVPLVTWAAPVDLSGLGKDRSDPGSITLADHVADVARFIIDRGLAMTDRAVA